jgi:hypothetical protein
LRIEIEVGPGGRQIQPEDPDGYPIEPFEPAPAASEEIKLPWLAEMVPRNRRRLGTFRAVSKASTQCGLSKEQGSRYEDHDLQSIGWSVW